MALTKAVPTALGVDATYWRIVEASAQHDAGTVQVWLRGYASEQARQDGRDGMALRMLTVPGAALPGGTHGYTTAELAALPFIELTARDEASARIRRAVVAAAANRDATVDLVTGLTAFETAALSFVEIGITHLG